MLSVTYYCYRHFQILKREEEGFFFNNYRKVREISIFYTNMGNKCVTI